MRSNAWIALENSIAQAWKQYYLWYVAGQEGPEPGFDDWDKKAIRKLVDIDLVQGQPHLDFSEAA